MEDNTIYRIVINNENGLSIYPCDRPIPVGWRDAGVYGTLEECMCYLKERCENVS
jgi:MbtH protein